ncbi:MAG: Xaa-Pro peptidase family protein [Desulfobacteraceae bacterium]|nr:Xaa-Pro peptidase family protein [Desulfobacteraceae bacterium]
MSQIFRDRLSEVRNRMSQNAIDALLVMTEENRRYLSGFTGEDHHFDESAGVLIITADSQVLATDSRFELQAQQEAPLFETIIYRNGLSKELAALAAKLSIRKMGFESVRVSVQQHRNFLKELDANSQKVELIPFEEFVESLRVIKSEDEIQKTAKALHIAEEVYRHVVKTLKPGMSEKQIAWAMEMGMRQAGADALSFPVIVAAGPNSALPHAIPSDREIQAGEPILFDWGAKLNGYCSDTSRTVVIGSPDDTFKQVYRTTLDAQQKAIAAIKSGISSKDVDAKARDHIHQNGYEGKFGHGLGHGTGLAVHEAPRLSPLRETVLQEGMLVTVEPGIYLPGWGGVRIENQVVVEADGPRVLNHLSTSCFIDQI